MVEVCAREQCVYNVDGGNVSYFDQMFVSDQCEFSDPVSLSRSEAPSFGKEESGEGRGEEKGAR